MNLFPSALQGFAPLGLKHHRLKFPSILVCVRTHSPGVSSITKAAGQPKEDARVAPSTGFGGPRLQDKSMVLVGKCQPMCVSVNQEQWPTSQLLV